MADRTAIRSRIQAVLFGLYRRARRGPLLRTRLGRRFFESAYLAYKILIEAGPISRLKPYAAQNSWVIDVGANIGIFTTRFAKWVQPGGRVVAIEPEMENFISLQRRLVKAGVDRHTLAIQAVAAESPGQLFLTINPDHPGDHRIGETGISIAAVTIDSILADNRNPSVSLIKIDAQGAEMRVLRGATATIERCLPALFIEIDDAALRSQHSTARELVAFLAAYGYEAYRLRRLGPPEPISPHALGCDGYGYEDVLFLHHRLPTGLAGP